MKILSGKIFNIIFKNLLPAIIFPTLLSATMSSCYIINYEEEVDFDLSYEVNSTDTLVRDSILFDLAVYGAEYKQYIDYLEKIEILSVTYSVSEFEGAVDQVIRVGKVTVSDENGAGCVDFAIIPEIALAELLISEQELELVPEGLDRAEELVINSPNRCLAILTAVVAPAPARFTIKFRINARINGSLL